MTKKTNTTKKTGRAAAAGRSSKASAGKPKSTTAKRSAKQPARPRGAQTSLKGNGAADIKASKKKAGRSKALEDLASIGAELDQVERRREELAKRQSELERTLAHAGGEPDRDAPAAERIVEKLGTGDRTITKLQRELELPHKALRDALERLHRERRVESVADPDHPRRRLQRLTGLGKATASGGSAKR